MYNGVSFFSGIGGFELGLHLAGLSPYIQISQFIECNPHAQRVLRKNFPGVPICDDVRTYNPEGLDGDKTIMYGGFPCQDISQAGKRRGIKEGTRSGLFFELMRCIRLVRPRIVYLENVAALLARGGGMDIVLGELSQVGYDAEWSVVSAASVGAVHLRERVWIIAYPNGERQRQQAIKTDPSRIGGEAWMGAEECDRGNRAGGLPQNASIASYPNSIGWDSSGSSQRQHRDLLHQEWDAQENQQSGSQWQCEPVPIRCSPANTESGGRDASWDKNNQGQPDPTSECRSSESTYTTEQGLEGCIGGRVSGERGQPKLTDNAGEFTNGTDQRSRSCSDGQPKTNASVCGVDDGVPSGVDNTRGRGIYLLRHSDLQEWLPLATDTQKIPYRKERLEELGNAVVPHAAAVGWHRVGQILGLQ